MDHVTLLHRRFSIENPLHVSLSKLAEWTGEGSMIGDLPSFGSEVDVLGQEADGHFVSVLRIDLGEFGDLFLVANETDDGYEGFSVRRVGEHKSVTNHAHDQFVLLMDHRRLIDEDYAENSVSFLAKVEDEFVEMMKNDMVAVANPNHFNIYRE